MKADDGLTRTTSGAALEAKGPPALRGRWLAIARATWAIVAILALALFLGSIPLYLRQLGQFTPAERDALLTQFPSVTVSPSPEFEFAADFVSTSAYLGASLACLVLAGILFWRKGEERMTVFVSFFLLVFGVVMTGPFEMVLGAIRPESLGLAWALQNALIAPLAVLFYLFPDGRFVPGWTRWLAIALAPWTLLMLIFPAPSWLSPTPLVAILWVFCTLSIIFAQVYRYRRVSTPAQRQQTKWVVVGFVGWTFVLLGIGVVFYISPPSLPGGQLSVADMVFIFVLRISWPIGLSLIPLSMGIAVLRYRLWDIDILIRRTLVYSVLSVLLALIYFGGVVLVQQLTRSISASSDLAIVVSTLAIAALFFPLRRRVQNALDRRFFRRKYDAQKVLAQFAATARDETDLEKLTARLVEVVQETMQPAHVSLWLKPTIGGRRWMADRARRLVVDSPVVTAHDFPES